MRAFLLVLFEEGGGEIRLIIPFFGYGKWAEIGSYLRCKEYFNISSNYSIF